MIDLNYLKLINDNFGHDKGNIAIKKICNIVCVTFKHSPVFRIGGDEFVVILENEDYDNIHTLIKQFRDGPCLTSKQTWAYKTYLNEPTILCTKIKRI